MAIKQRFIAKGVLAMEIDVDELSKNINKYLMEYSSDVTKKLEVSKKKVADDGVSELRATSPRRTGGYASGWTQRKVGRERVIYNKTHASLTHLLENGHANRDGGYTPGIPHIAPVEQHVIEEFKQEVERDLQS